MRINPDGGYVVSACFSAFSKIVSISDISKKRLHSSEIPDRVMTNPRDASDFISSFIDKIFKDNTLDRSRLLGAGIVVAGSINSGKGYLINAPLLNWNEFPIKAYLEEKLQCGVIIENIADALCQTCLGDRQTKTLKSENILLVHNAAGMGASLSIGGKILRQHADENWIAKIPLGYDLSYAPQIKTLGSVSSGHAVLKEANIIEDISHQFADCLNFAINETINGNTNVQEAFYKAGFQLGLALFPLTVAYLPDRIVLAGPTGTNPFFESGVRNGYRQFSKTLEIPTAKICTLNTSYIDASQDITLQKFFMDTQMLDLKSYAN